MYIVILTYNNINKIDEHLNEHRLFLDKYYALNKFICSGAQNPRTGGVILCNADSKIEVECIISEDPFNKNKVATYEIIEFSVTKFAPAFESFVIQK
ncbi:MAG: YciI family protein [Paludibacter sp.]|nr:YciI family protein [Paludibacter sp.]